MNFRGVPLNKTIGNSIIIAIMGEALIVRECVQRIWDAVTITVGKRKICILPGEEASIYPRLCDLDGEREVTPASPSV